MSTHTPALVRFYSPTIADPDSHGRTLTQILAWPDSDLEYHHDYIQILFPLPEGSPFNPSAPIIDKPTFDAFRSDPALQSRFRQSLTRMLTFYGFEFEDDGTIAPGICYPLASRNWVKRFNHNHLRITRIIRSLRVLGLEAEAEEFFKALKGVYERSGKISERSLMYWTRAAERPLFIAPEDEEDGGKGAKFLYEFEAGRRAGASDGEVERGVSGDGLGVEESGKENQET